MNNYKIDQLLVVDEYTFRYFSHWEDSNCCFCFDYGLTSFSNDNGKIDSSYWKNHRLPTEKELETKTVIPQN